ncbi:MAG: ATP-binding protein [bacterium]|nr:ATP-binding protein [bacterium]
MVFGIAFAGAPACAPDGREDPAASDAVSDGGESIDTAGTAGPTATFVARGGEIDLRDWNVERDGPVVLEGDWRFEWMRMPGDESASDDQGAAARGARAGPVLVEVPHVWKRSDAADFAEHGFATYRLRILLPAGVAPRRFAMRIPDLNTAYRLEVNGTPLHSVGVPGRTAGQTISGFRPEVVWVAPALIRGGRSGAAQQERPESLEIVFVVSNFVLAKGGLDEPISFGTLEQLEAEEERDRTLAIFTAGALGIMGVYQLILFSLRRGDRRLLWFALFCLAIALRVTLTGEYLLGRWLPGLPFVWLLSLEYLTLGLGTLTIAFYLGHLFPREFPRWFRPLIATVAGGYIAVVLLGPVTFAYQLLFAFQFVALATTAVSVWCVILAIRRGREGALNTFGGGLFFVAAVMLDILTSRGLFFASGWSDVAPYALIIFIIFQAFILSRSAARAFATAEALSLELEDRVRRRTEDLNESRLQAEAANRAKSEFLATMSHELRTPLNSIIGTAELLGESALDENQADYVRVLNRAGRNLLFQVNDILDISRIEADRLELRPESIDLEALVGETESVLRIRADQKGLALKVETHLDEYLEPGEVIIADPARLQQVLVNLLGNAIKFTESGSVELRVSAESRTNAGVTLCFAVSDTGIGIAPDQQARIFDNFAQADSSSSRRYEGTGLGLAISQRLVELMDGEIGVESEVGKGSRFWFRARFPAAPPGEEQSGTHSKTRFAERPRSETSASAAAATSASEASQITAPADGATAIAGLRILLVEDNEDNYFLIRKFLESSEIDLIYAADGRQAVEAVQAAGSELDLVLMDLQMPVMDGYEATRTIRAEEIRTGRAPVPILALTANATVADVEKTKAGGFDGHLSKPITKRRLIAAIASSASSAAHVSKGEGAGVDSIDRRETGG